jgi:hypothetical protein
MNKTMKKTARMERVFVLGDMVRIPFLETRTKRPIPV